MAKKDFKEFVCIPFCTFFREDSSEELACRGALLFDKLLRHGHLRLDTLPGLSRDLDFRGKHDADLDAIVCRQCSFQKEDCDFQSEENRWNAEPCGGYLVLSLLKMAGLINPADLEEKRP